MFVNIFNETLQLKKFQKKRKIEKFFNNSNNLISTTITKSNKKTTIIKTIKFFVNTLTKRKKMNNDKNF